MQQLRNNRDIQAPVHYMMTPTGLSELCNSHDPFFMVTVVEKFYQVGQGLQEFVILKVTEKDI